jgi:hypothetical protein
MTRDVIGFGEPPAIVAPTTMNAEDLAHLTSSSMLRGRLSDDREHRNDERRHRTVAGFNDCPRSSVG